MAPVARERGGGAEGQRHRQSAHDAAHRAGEGAQGSLRHAAAVAARAAAHLVAGGPGAREDARWRLAVSRPESDRVRSPPGSSTARCTLRRWWPGSTSGCRCTRCGTASPPTCWNRRSTSGSSRCCSGTRTRHHRPLCPGGHRPAARGDQSAGAHGPRVASPDGARRPGGRGYLPRPRAGLAASAARSPEPGSAQGDVRHRTVPQRGAGGTCTALRRLCAGADRLQLLPQPALPEVSGACRAAVAGSAAGRPAAGRLLPPGVHAAGADQCHRVLQQGSGLRPAVRGRRGDAAHHRRRPQASRRAGRRDAGPAYLGLGADAPSACARHRSRRWPRRRR